MDSLPHGYANCSILLEKRANSYVGNGYFCFPPLAVRRKSFWSFRERNCNFPMLIGKKAFTLPEKRLNSKFSKKQWFLIPRSTTSSNSSCSNDGPSDQTQACTGN
ncbi:hypothetical protein L6164_005433 [Bauhinia variegata]|uniref:Uncharacterized protein n=1 Tax=Bauhinia variegata TaxID=167791 RepID=A0ACB9PRS4_BAUVA|nr:hypothetical protein L6164_005433 [Bauhinia variegata]